ncbi:MAG TPA: TIGR03663 family protein, partial [Anaerolineales bacterium]|nr:TIGR03663 family protein [Anaerolineales bacterium]
METPQTRASWLDRPIAALLNADWETLAFALILILGLLSRFYNLEPRVMSHDENSHVYYSWRLYKGDGYQHTPVTHGPFLFHVTALSYFLFGDSDTTSRLPYALFGFAAIAFIWAYRRYLGRAGTLIAAALMLISPYMLYYSRYVRNEAFVMLFGVITIWAVLRYLETGKPRYTYWLTAATVLHFTAKETSFIYVAQVLLFTGLLFVYQSTRQKWAHKNDRTAFIGLLITAVAFLAMAIVLYAIAAPVTAPVEGEVSSSGAPPVFTTVPIILSGASLLAALFFAVHGYTWERLRQNRPFGLMLLLFTLILPHLVALPVRMLGWDPLDYSSAGIIRTGFLLVPLVFISAGAGLLWNKQLWLVNAAIFYIPFTLLYTTFFTNGVGFFSGLVGSLGYWLEQQGVQRGSQPWYYYVLLQVPVYEFL